MNAVVGLQLATTFHLFGTQATCDDDYNSLHCVCEFHLVNWLFSHFLRKLFREGVNMSYHRMILYNVCDLLRS